MKSLKTWVIILLALAIAAAGWLYWPRSLAKLINWEHAVQATHIMAEDQPDAATRLGTASFTLEPGSPEHAALQALFSRFRWHRGFDTLFQNGANRFMGKSAFQFSEAGPGGTLIEVAEGSGFVSLNGRAAKIGYFGAGDARKLVEGVLDIVSALNPAD